MLIVTVTDPTYCLSFLLEFIVMLCSSERRVKFLLMIFEVMSTLPKMIRDYISVKRKGRNSTKFHRQESINYRFHGKCINMKASTVVRTFVRKCKKIENALHATSSK